MQLNLSYTPAQIESLLECNKKYTIITKGRRVGVTHGAALAIIEWAIMGYNILWGDTIASNCSRYFARYMEPTLKKNKIPYSFNVQRKELEILNGRVDFRSADIPENWEGFGYNVIFLNEAGIILKNNYLYTNAVLPMLIDYPDSRLIAAGVPKGKVDKQGNPHVFYKLYQSAIEGQPGYAHFNYSSYDNPLLQKEDIENLEVEIGRMNPAMVQQEIYGQFIDGAGGVYWDDEIIERQRVQQSPFLSRKVVAIDPATTKTATSDETGIIGLGKSNHNIYVVADKSGKYSPNEWALAALELAKEIGAGMIIAEKNQGGDMVSTIIHQHNPNMRVVLVHASKGKELRAEPVFGLYEQGRVWHVGSFTKLENELKTIGNTTKSPNRLDALVYGVLELNKQHQTVFRR